MLKSIFKFWGFPHEAWRQCVGSDRSLCTELGDPSPAQLGRVFLEREMIDLIEPLKLEIASEFNAYIQALPAAPKPGKILARFEVPRGSESVPLVTKDPQGSVRFHFDVERSIDFVRQQRYTEHRPPFYLKFGITPDSIPASLRMLIRTGFNLSRAGVRLLRRPAVFPSSYKDMSVDAWLFIVRALIERFTEGKYASMPLWPEGKRYAIILNHDVDSAWAFENPGGIEFFRRAEEERGFRSAWMVVTKLHQAGRDCLDRLHRSEHEIGFHGTHHDHRLAYLPPEGIRERIEQARSFLDAYQCVGFRSPSYHRSWNLFRQLDSVIRYDMSMHDCFENVNSPLPRSEGCSTCFPFYLDGTGILEIPSTVPEDFVLEMKRFSPGETLEFQIKMIESIKKRMGVAGILTHPEPQLSSRAPWRSVYQSLLEHIGADKSAWVALPREVCDWWRRRCENIDRTWNSDTDSPAAA